MNPITTRFTLVCMSLACICGCQISVIPTPDSVLLGSWVLTGDQISTFIDKTLTFDASGNLIRVVTRRDNSGTIQQIVQDDLSRAAEVSGGFVRISIPGSLATGFLDDIVFEGNLNTALTEATGQLQTETNFFGDTIITPQGPGKIVRL